MAEREKGIYIHLPEELDRQIELMAFLLPPKADGKKWYKKQLVARAVEVFVEKFNSLVDDNIPMNEMLRLAKEFPIEDRSMEEDIPDEEDATGPVTVDMPTDDSGLKEF